MDEKVFAKVLETDSVHEIVSFVKNHSALNFFENANMNFGNSPIQIDLERLAKWFLYRCNIVGAAEVAKELQRFIDSPNIPGVDVMAITGISVDQEVKLTPEISLIPYNDLADSQEKARLDPNSVDPRFREKLDLSSFRILTPAIPRAALIMKNASSPKFLTAQSPNGYISKAQTLIDVCHCLTLIGPSAPMPLLGWWEADDWIPYSKLYNYSLNTPLIELVNISTYTWEPNDMEKAPMLIERYMNLADDCKKRLHIPINRLNKAACNIKYVNKAIELGLAVESIFVADDEKSEISYRIQQRAAWFLGKDYDDRREITKLFKGLYDCRSNAVHRGKILNKFKGIPTLEIIEQGAKKTAEAIDKIIQSGIWPDWNVIDLSSKNSDKE